MRRPGEYVDEEAPTNVFVRRTSAPRQARSSTHRGASDMLTVKEAADFLRVNVKTIHAMLADGLPHLRPTLRVIRIERSVLTSWHKVA